MRVFGSVCLSWQMWETLRRASRALRDEAVRLRLQDMCSARRNSTER